MGDEGCGASGQPVLSEAKDPERSSSPIPHPPSRAPLAAIAALSAALSLSGCEWFTDFKEQPSVHPWESKSDTVPFRGNPQLSVSTLGTQVAAFQVSYAPTPMTVDSMSGLANPHPVTEASLVNGRKYYSINCAVCHGDNGAGTGAVTRYQPAFAISLIAPQAQNRSDGYIFGMIRNGRGLMPPYNRIEEADRWDVVNYVRGLQGKLGGPVPIGPPGLPGETGDKLPGPTQTGPQRPMPHNVTLRDTVGPASATAGPAAVPGTPAAEAAARGQPTIGPATDSAARRSTTPRPPR